MSRFIDITGKTFGRLTVTRFLGRAYPTSRQTVWELRCAECGQKCRYHDKRKMAELGAKPCRCDGTGSHPHRSRWVGLKDRSFPVCARWLKSYRDFCNDIGDEPANRPCLCPIDKSKPFGPGNFAWTTKREACALAVDETIVTIDGQSKTINEWIKVSGVKRTTIIMRLKAGWSPEDAVFQKTSHHYLTEKQKRRIIALHKQGKTFAEIAKVLSVHPSTVRWHIIVHA